MDINIHLIDDDINGDMVYSSAQCQMGIYSRGTFKKYAEHVHSVYMLLGTRYEDRRQIYIGQTKDIYRRLCEHDRLKDFWVTAIVFTFNDIVTRDEMEWLEMRLIDKFANSNMFNLVTNSQLPKEVIVHDTDKMTVIFDIYCLMLGLYGITPIQMYFDGNTRQKTAYNSISARMCRQYYGQKEQDAHDITVTMIDDDMYEYVGEHMKGSYFEMTDGRIFISNGSSIINDNLEELCKIYEIKHADLILSEDLMLNNEKDLKKLIGEFSMKFN